MPVFEYDAALDCSAVAEHPEVTHSAQHHGHSHDEHVPAHDVTKTQRRWGSVRMKLLGLLARPAWDQYLENSLQLFEQHCLAVPDS